MRCAAALFARATTAFVRELLGLSEALGAAGRDLDLLAQDDKTLLAELMIQALRTDPLASKETRLRLRGQLALRKLLSGQWRSVRNRRSRLQPVAVPEISKRENGELSPVSRGRRAAGSRAAQTRGQRPRRPRGEGRAARARRTQTRR